MGSHELFEEGRGEWSSPGYFLKSINLSIKLKSAKMKEKIKLLKIQLLLFEHNSEKFISHSKRFSHKRRDPVLISKQFFLFSTFYYFNPWRWIYKAFSFYWLGWNFDEANMDEIWTGQYSTCEWNNSQKQQMNEKLSGRNAETKIMNAE